MWARPVDEVQSANKNAGTISPESLPDDLRTAFTHRVYAVLPTEFSEGQLPSPKPDWNRHAHASDLVIANLLGAWDEKNASTSKSFLNLQRKSLVLGFPRSRRYYNNRQRLWPKKWEVVRYRTGDFVAGIGSKNFRYQFGQL